MASLKSWTRTRRSSGGTATIPRAPLTCSAPSWETFYGLPQDSNVMGLWYNKDTLAKYNLAEPKSYQDLLATCATLKANGVVPMAMAGKWPAITTRLLDALLDTTLGAAAHDAMFTGKTHFDNPGHSQGVPDAQRRLGRQGLLPGRLPLGRGRRRIRALLSWEGPPSGTREHGRSAGSKRTTRTSPTSTSWPSPPVWSPYRINTFGNAWWMPKYGKKQERGRAVPECHHQPRCAEERSAGHRGQLGLPCSASWTTRTCRRSSRRS